MKKILLASLITSISCTASADFLFGGDIEANVWQQNQTFMGNTSGDLEDSQHAYTFEASIEHFIPLVPNPKIAISSIDGDDYKYTKRDFTLYYEFLDNDLISVDAGAGVTQLSDGSIRNTSTSSWENFDGYIPHLYAAVEIGIPATPFFVYAKGTGISFADNEMKDFSVGLQYSIPMYLMDIEIQGGYRSQEFNLVGYEGLDLDMDAKTDGFFVGVNIDF